MWDINAQDLTQGTYDNLDFGKSLGYDFIYLCFVRGHWDTGIGLLEDPLLSGNLTPEGTKCLDKLVEEAHKRFAKVNLGMEWYGGSNVVALHQDLNYVRDFCKMWSSLAALFNGDTRLYSMGSHYNNVGAGLGWEFYTSLEGCQWWAERLQIWMDSIWNVDPNRRLIAGPMTDMGSTATLMNDYWTPELLNLRGPVIWRKMSST